MKYLAKDLAEIADAFDKRAANATQQAARKSLTGAERRTAETEARIWSEAATWLRDTELR